MEGDPETQPLVVLVSGVGSTLIEWPDAFVSHLSASGRAVLTFDNRDCGRSSMLSHITPKNYVAMAIRGRVPFIRRCDAGRSGGYSLDDMAADAWLLLDA